jgi:capping protein alpha
LFVIGNNIKMAEPTDEELIEIANNFLLNSPPGEFMEVVTDVRALLPNESMINESAPRTFREYNTEQMIQVESPGQTHKVLITKYGEVSDGEYLDPKGGQVITFDHIRQEVTGKRPIRDELESSLEPLRQAFEKHTFDYVSQHFPHGTTTTYGKDGQIIVCISSARFNPQNFWNGRWRSVWTFANGELVGHFKIVVHYYEDGNVQLNTDTTQKVAIPESGSPDAIATAALKAITKAEQAYQQALDASYATMGETTYKALRRALPITRQRIDWNKIKNYKIGSDMTGK